MWLCKYKLKRAEDTASVHDLGQCIDNERQNEIRKPLIFKKSADRVLYLHADILPFKSLFVGVLIYQVMGESYLPF